MSLSDIPYSVLAQYPALAPPPGVKSNFIDPPSHDTSLIALNTIFLFLMVIVVSIRLYAKGVLMHTLGWDDYICALAAVTSAVHSGVLLSGLRYGYGRHLWDIRAITMLDVSNVRTMTATSTIYPIVICLVKVSILLLYLRIFGVNQRVRYLVYFGLLFLGLFYVSYFGVQLGILMLCVTQDSTTKYDLCKNEFAILVFQSVFNVCSDFYVFLIPIPCILNLQVTKRHKIGLLLIFLTGFVACLLSIARLVALAITFHGADTLWTAAISSEFTIVEINLAIIASCTTTLPGFLTVIAGSSIYRSIQTLFSSSRSNNTTRRSKAASDVYRNGVDDSGKSHDNAYIELKAGAVSKKQHGDVDSTSDNIPLRG